MLGKSAAAKPDQVAVPPPGPLAKLPLETLMTRDELARLFGVTAGTIIRWARDGMPVAKGGGQGRQAGYLPSACVAWRLAQLEARSPDHEGLFPAVERARKDRAQAQLAEQQLKIRSGEYVAIREVEEELARKVGATQTKLLTIPRAAAP
jgi:phage terminase Nu1 subunit (DNA packaging protein)